MTSSIKSLLLLRTPTFFYFDVKQRYGAIVVSTRSYVFQVVVHKYYYSPTQHIICARVPKAPVFARMNPSVPNVTTTAYEEGGKTACLVSLRTRNLSCTYIHTKSLFGQAKLSMPYHSVPYYLMSSHRGCCPVTHVFSINKKGNRANRFGGIAQ